MPDIRLEDTTKFLIGFGAVIGGTGVAILMMFFTISERRAAIEEVHQEAIKHHAAHWDASEDGKAVFLWNDGHNEVISK